MNFLVLLCQNHATEHSPYLRDTFSLGGWVASPCFLMQLQYKACYGGGDLGKSP